MGSTYLVLGSGRQGTAAAYDLARFGDAERLTLADADINQARSACERVNELAGKTIAEPLALDVRDEAAVRRAFAGQGVVLSAVPYYYNLGLTHLAIESKVSYCDLGGNTDLVRQQHALNDAARAAGVRIVPDCGMGPGMGNSLAVYAMELLDRPEHVFIYDGGLPRHPQPPWNYRLTFHIEGLTNEYAGALTVLRQGELIDIPPFSELETIDFPPLGEVEAFIVGGGASTAPWTFHGKLQTYQLKILRYPGSFSQLKAFSDLGLFSLDPVNCDGGEVIPRHLFNTLFEPQVRFEDTRDICLIRVRALGEKSGKTAEAVVELVDEYDPATGFTSMERTTGWHAAIVMALMARGETPLGSIPLEVAVPGGVFVREARKRGFQITERVLTTG